MKIFVLHYAKLTERKRHIIEQFERHGITDYEIIEKFDKDLITDDECPEFSRDYINNRRAELSLHLKHIYTYRLMVRENYDQVLIFEDDVILSEGFIPLLNLYMTQLPKEYDMLFIGDGCNLHIPISMQTPNKYIYEKCLHETAWGGNGAAKCTDSYIISNMCAKKICDYIDTLITAVDTKKINLPADWWLNQVARELTLKVYWAEPTIVTQGSQNGTYYRSL
ncbi:MAG: glycosyltransferase family 25 protein [Gammaproteobacteria bacterium]|nr:glycosyltransferase family 25 protein [Gammaproteobacteria bacterium]